VGIDTYVRFTFQIVSVVGREEAGLVPEIDAIVSRCCVPASPVLTTMRSQEQSVEGRITRWRSQAVAIASGGDRLPRARHRMLVVVLTVT
jgi:hypothetical protein